jgi:sulfur transfer complex TusBCD TusB component (DsrH family)
MFELLPEIIPFAFFFITLIFLLALKKDKGARKEKEHKIQSFTDQDHRELLEKNELKLVALKDLYKQELIDVKVYLRKTELIARKISDEIGKNILELPKLQQKIIFNNLKKEIEKKVDNAGEKNVKTNIETLINAVDNRIRSGANNEKE